MNHERKMEYLNAQGEIAKLIGMNHLAKDRAIERLIVIQRESIELRQRLSDSLTEMQREEDKDFEAAIGKSLN